MLSTTHKKEELARTGVYKIMNTLNGKFYIGSTSQSFLFRIQKHITKLIRNKHHSRYLQNSWNKHGSEKFEFFIVEFCDPAECLKREQHYLDLLSPFVRSVGYNVLPNAISSLGVKRSAEFREKCRERMLGRKPTPEQTRKRSASLAGRECSLETRLKISKANSGKKRTEEAKLKISASKKGFKKTPEAIEKTAKFLRGKRKTKEAIEKSRRKRTGLKRSQEQIESIKLGTKAGKERKKIFELFVTGISSVY